MRFRNPLYQPLHLRIPLVTTMILATLLAAALLVTLAALTIKLLGGFGLLLMCALVSGTAVSLVYGETGEEYLEAHTEWHRVPNHLPHFIGEDIVWFSSTLERRLVPDTRNWTKRQYQLEHGKWEYR